MPTQISVQGFKSIIQQFKPSLAGSQSICLSLCVAWRAHIAASALSGWINPSCTWGEKKKISECFLRQKSCGSCLGYLGLRHNWGKPLEKKKQTHLKMSAITTSKIWKTPPVLEQMLQLVMGGSRPADCLGWLRTPGSVGMEERRDPVARRNELDWREGSWLSPMQASGFEGGCLRDSGFLKIMFSAEWNRSSCWCSFWLFYLLFHLS